MSGLNRTWFVETTSGRVGRLDTQIDGVSVNLWEWPLPSANSQPQGIAVDSSGHAWITESAVNKIAEWRPPYLHFVYLPVVVRQ
jgi:streptogramin lyase